MAPLRWGICSAGKVSQDFVNALSILPSENHQVVAVAARNGEKAKEFAEAHNIAKYYSGYVDLFAEKDVDVIYIGTVTCAHEETVLKALDAGKHVLCENMMAINAKETARMIQKAQTKGLFLMEAYWTRFMPAMTKLREEIISGAIGEPKIVCVNIGLPSAKYDVNLDLGYGATSMFGGYLPMIVQYAFFSNSPLEKPIKISVSGTKNEQNLDNMVAVSIQYSNEKVGTCLYSMELDLPNDVIIAGEKGYIRIPDHSWCPTTLITPNGQHDFPLPQSDRKFNYPNSVALCYEAEHVRRCLLEGLKESPVMTLKESLILAEISDEIRKQMEVRLPQD